MPQQRAHRYPRTARVNEVIVEIVAEELSRLSDPRLELVTVTGAEASTDLALRDVYYSALDGGGHRRPKQQATATAAALHKATPHLRRVSAGRCGGATLRR